MPLITPSAFRPDLDEIEISTSIAAGTHALDVFVASRPGSSIEVSVRSSDAVAVPAITEEGRLLSVEDVTVAPALFSPNGDDVLDQSTFAARLDVERLPGPPNSNWEIEWAFEVVEDDECVTVATVQGVIPIDAAGPTTVSAPWDGTDDAGNVVPDGRYAVRLKTKLVRVSPGPGQVLDVVATDARRVTVDTTPPQLRISSPTVSPPGGEVRIYENRAEEELVAIAFDPNGIDETTVRANQVDIPHTLTIDGFLTATIPLATEDPSGIAGTRVELSATDRAGVTATVTIPIVVVAPVVPGELVVQFAPWATDEEIDRQLSEIAARVARVSGERRRYSLLVDPSADTRQLASELRESGHVVAAVAPPPMLTSGTGPPNDPLFATPGQWHLDNSDDYYFFVEQPCLTDIDCVSPQETCITDGVCLGSDRFGTASASCSSLRDCPSGACAGTTTGVCWSRKGPSGLPGGLVIDPTTDCKADADCEDGFACASSVGFCGKQGRDDADIGWLDARQQVCDASTTRISVAVIDFGIGHVDHPELTDSAVRNNQECCGLNFCPTLPGQPTPCQKGDANGDGSPGVAGEDDDGDGYADWDDPEVRELIVRLCCNEQRVADGGQPIDDDDDGVPGDGCGELPAGIELPPGCPAFAPTVADPEWMLAAHDDDENGLIDDLRGFHFGLATRRGEPAGATFPADLDQLQHQIRDIDGCLDPVRGGADCDDVRRHPTAVAGAVLAGTDNLTFGAGVHPAVDLTFIATDGLGDLSDALDYAVSTGIEFVVLSIEGVQACNDFLTPDGDLLPCAGSLRTRFLGWRASTDLLWASATDSTIMYNIAAGNEGWDLSSGAFPDADGFCSGAIGGLCVSSVLANIDTFPDPGAVGPSNNLVVAANNPRGELAARWPGDGSSGTNFGASRPEGGNPIDLAAPGESLLLPSAESTGTGMTGDFNVRRTRGTSFAAPIAAGVGALVASTFPELRRRPAAIVDRLVSTRRACQTSAGGARSCDQAMLHPGIVDVAGALDLGNSPPPVGPWVDDTFLLGPSRIGAGNVQDVKMFSPTTSSSAETMLLELSGGVDGVRYLPRLWEWDELQGRFRPVAGTALPRIPVEGTTETEPLRGNFSEAAIADFDGDGCTDMAWAGFVEPNPDSSRRCSGPGTSACMTDADCPADEVCEPLLPLREVDNLLLFQERTPLGDCTGRFNDVTAARYPLPNGGVSRDIDVLDANGDGRPDLLITNSDFQPGLWTSTVLDQLLINVDCPPLTPGSPFGCFVDEAAARFPITTFEDEENVTTSMGCDVNGDGHEDIVRVSPIDPDQVLVNDGTGRFNIDANSGIGDDALSLSHDAVCADLFGNDGLSDIVVARGGGAPSYGTLTTAFDAGATDLGPRKNRFFVNGFASGVPGEFSDESSAVLPGVADHSRAVAACDLDGDGFPELVFANGEEPQRGGNGTASLPTRETNRILAVQPLLAFEDVDDVLGFDFHPNGTIRDDGVTDDGSSVTSAIECGDLDGDGRDDALIFGNVAHQGLRMYRLEVP